MNLKEYSKNIQSNSEQLYSLISACSHLLKTSPSAQLARDYINSRCSLNSQKNFGFGYFPSNENIDELFKIFPKEKLKEMGIVYDYTVQDADVLRRVPHSFFAHNNLIMPFKNLHGDIMSLVGRTLTPKHLWPQNRIQKYKYTKNFNKRFHLFGLNHAKKSIIKNNCVILVEGQFDCITCHSNGFYNVVAVGGAELSSHQYYLLKRYTNNFYFLLDNDQAGETGYQKCVDKYSSTSNIQKIELPKKFKDVDDYIQNSSVLDILSF